MSDTTINRGLDLLENLAKFWIMMEILGVVLVVLALVWMFSKLDW
jgi:hypothetical protein